MLLFCVIFLGEPQWPWGQDACQELQHHRFKPCQGPLLHVSSLPSCCFLSSIKSTVSCNGLKIIHQKTFGETKNIILCFSEFWATLIDTFYTIYISILLTNCFASDFRYIWYKWFDNTTLTMSVMLLLYVSSFYWIIEKNHCWALQSSAHRPKVKSNDDTYICIFQFSSLFLVFRRLLLSLYKVTEAILCHFGSIIYLFPCFQSHQTGTLNLCTHRD